MVTFFQSEIVGCSEFLAAFPTANEISGRVHLVKIIKDPITLLYVVILNGSLFLLITLSPTQGVLVFLVYLIFTVFNSFSINPICEIMYLLSSFSTLIPRI